MNDTIDLLFHHRSIRKFKQEALTKQQIDTILHAASMASTSSYMMAYTIIGVTDESKKSKLAEISGQAYVKDNGHLLLFCADFYRNTLYANETQYNEMKINLENTEHFLVATIDAALAAQNAAIAAEALGLGICYLGSLRNNIEAVDKLFELPEHVIPLFGMAIGVPDHNPDKKPRLPIAAFYSENEYVKKEELTKSLQQFDNTIQTYYQNRSTNKRLDSWTDQMIKKLATPKRMDVSSFVQSKSFNKN